MNTQTRFYETILEFKCQSCDYHLGHGKIELQHTDFPTPACPVITRRLPISS